MTTTHTLKDGRVLKLVDIDRKNLRSTSTSCAFCVAFRAGENPEMCVSLPPCSGLRSWMDDEAWAKYVAEGLMK